MNQEIFITEKSKEMENKEGNEKWIKDKEKKEPMKEKKR